MEQCFSFVTVLFYNDSKTPSREHYAMYPALDVIDISNKPPVIKLVHDFDWKPLSKVDPVDGILVSRTCSCKHFIIFQTHKARNGQTTFCM